MAFVMQSGIFIVAWKNGAEVEDKVVCVFVFGTIKLGKYIRIHVLKRMLKIYFYIL